MMKRKLNAVSSFIIIPFQFQVLERLANMPDVFVAVISGRSVNNVREMVGIEGITYAGNHGLEIIHPDGTKFTHPMPAEQEGRVGALLQRLQEECCRDGAWVENKGVLLTFHFRNVPVEKREPIVTRARELITEAGFMIGNAHCALEIKPPVLWDKGRASIYILRTAFGVDWSDRIRIIYAGDDVTDEDAMSALKGMAYSFRVVSSSLTQTAADKRLPSTDSVVCLLRWVESHMAQRTPRASKDRHSPQALNTLVHIPDARHQQPTGQQQEAFGDLAHQQNQLSTEASCDEESVKADTTDERLEQVTDGENGQGVNCEEREVLAEANNDDLQEASREDLKAVLDD